MSRFFHLARTIGLVALTVAALGTTAVAQNSFTEDFTTLDHHSGSTTADWNTAAGELRLHPFVVSELGNVDTPGSARGIDIQGNLAYIADRYAGLQIVDISDPAAPVILSTFNTPGIAYRVQVSGNYAYVADHNAGMRVVDISNPAVPVSAGFYLMPGFVLDLCVEGDVAYLSCGADGLYVVNIDVPTSPVLMASLTTQWDSAQGLKIDGDWLYVADGNAGLAVVDVSDPSVPAIVGNVALTGSAKALAVRGNSVYVATDGGGLAVCSVTNPAAPSVVTEYAIAGTIRDVFVHGSMAYVAADASGLHAININSAISPYTAWTYDTVGHAFAVVANASQAFVADYGSGLRVLETAEEAAPEPAGAAYLGTTAFDLSVLGDRAYAASAYDGFYVMSISKDGSATKMAQVDPGAVYFQSTHASGDHLYTSESSFGMGVYDVASASSPVEVGRVSSLGTVYRVDVQGDRAYVGSSAGVNVVDITDPTAPIKQGLVSLGSVRFVQADGTLCWVASTTTLFAVDITEGWAPFQLGSVALGGTVRAMVVQGRLAFVGHNNGLEIFDLVNPAAPVSLGTLLGIGAVSEVTVDGDRALIVAGGTNIHLVDVSDPSLPVVVATRTTVGTCYSLALTGRYALANYSGSNNLQIYRIWHDDNLQAEKWGYSTAVDDSFDRIVAARLSSASRSGTMNISARCGAGAAWESLSLGGSWHAMESTGSSLYWRTELVANPSLAPRLNSLTLEWLNEFAHITSVADIPGDQGGQVRLQWRRSGYDFVGHENQIIEYAVYREYAEAKAGENAELPAELSGYSSALQENAGLMAASGWDFVTTVPVRVQDDYAVVVPTLADSTETGLVQSTFMVVALTATPGVYYDSHPFSGYSVDNLEPEMPTGIAANYSAGGVGLVWDEAVDADFRLFRVYRGTGPNFIPAVANLVHEGGVPAWNDPAHSPWQFHYKITAVDFSGNESPAGGVLNASDTPAAGPVLALRGAVPNPFNPATRIDYSVARAGAVRLQVFDVAGRLVRTLVNAEQEAGDHSVRWDGRNDQGLGVASGAYFALLRSGDEVRRQRMLLMK